MFYYFFAILDNIKLVLAISCFLGAITSFFVIFVLIVSTVDEWRVRERRIVQRIAKIFFPVFALIVLLTMFIPSQKQMAFIIAAPYIVENQELKDASQNTTEIIKLGTEYLKEVLKTKTEQNND